MIHLTEHTDIEGTNIGFLLRHYNEIVFIEFVKSKELNSIDVIVSLIKNKIPDYVWDLPDFTEICFFGLEIEKYFEFFLGYKYEVFTPVNHYQYSNNFNDNGNPISFVDFYTSLMKKTYQFATDKCNVETNFK